VHCIGLETSLVFENVCATYPTRRVPSLNAVTFRVPAGQQVGICGRTGAGKSTLLNAIFRLVQLDSGSICLGSMDLATVSVNRLHAWVAVVPQVPMLLHGSIAYNLAPSGCASSEELLAVLHDINLMPLLQQMVANHAILPTNSPAKEASDHVSLTKCRSETLPLLRSDGFELSPRTPGACSLEESVLQLVVGSGASNLPLAAQQQLCTARALLRKPACALATCVSMPSLTADMPAHDGICMSHTDRASFFVLWTSALQQCKTQAAKLSTFTFVAVSSRSRGSEYSRGTNHVQRAGAVQSTQRQKLLHIL
jgi:ABC-type multidrug transport system fused ATPase/permease subunit